MTSYIPQLTNSPIPGRVTTTTFVLDKPQCLFNQSSNNLVWLFVAYSTVTLSDNMLAGAAPYSSFSTNRYYRTYRTLEKAFPCSTTPDYIRVGDQTVCSDPDNCNGPLNSPGPYRVKFVVLDSTGKLIDQTGWSNPITLRTGKSSSVIDTWPGRRSGGMIVITSILSVLLAIFLACLIGTFIIGSKNAFCSKKTGKEKTVVQQEIDMKNYKTHHMQTNAPIYDEPIA
ncbi:uroplakin-3b isoform X2 [Mixophyes fleayi]